MPSETPENWFAGIKRFLQRWLVPYLPYPNLMALAPIDSVLRLLLRPPARIPWPYWPRLAFLLVASTLASIVSLPERLVLWAWLRFRPPVIEKHQAPIFVLGYFRSGTTFLQTLLAVDPALRSPRWAEALAPQAFVVGWTIARFLLVPFLPLTRVNEVVPLHPTFPAEDDFALNNWGLVSIMGGRLILPQAQPFYDRFHDLDSLTPAELARWRSYQRAFVEKLMLLSGGRRLVLKSPSHTARVRHLLKLFPGAKFVHISRPPNVVFQSNLLLLHTAQTAFGLQYLLPDDEQEEIVVREYLATEERYIADRAAIPAGDLAEVRLQDIAADPIGELRRIYRELELPFSAEYESRLKTLLTAAQRLGPKVHPEPSEAQMRRIARLQPLIGAFGHDRPPIPKVNLPAPPPQATSPRILVLAATVLVSLAVFAAWYFTGR